MQHASWIVTAAFLPLGALGGCSESTAPTQGQTPGPVTVAVAYCNGSQPDWVAFQDGDGAWTRATPAMMGDTISFQYVFHANRGGIATETRDGGGLTNLLVLFGAPAEIPTAGNTKALFCGTAASKALLGTVAGLDTNEAAVISAHVARATARPDNTFALQALGSGPHDLIAARHTRTGGLTAVTRIILRRDVDLPDSATVPLLDFGSPEALTPVTATVTVNGIGPEGATSVVRVLTKTSEVLLSLPPNASLDVARPYAALPLAQLRGDDVQEVLASAVNGSASRSTAFYFRSAADRIIALPAALVRPTIDTVVSAPVLRLRARFVAQADFDRAASIRYQQGTTTIVGVSMTAAYAALLTNGYELVVPDLSGAAGFDPAWALHAGSQVICIAGRVGGTLGLGANAIPGDGSIRRDAFDTDTIPGP